MQTMLDHVVKLHEECLHSNVVQLLNLLFPTTPTQCVSQDMFSPQQEFQILIMYADSLYHTKDFRKAEKTYGAALDLRRAIAKVHTKTKKSQTSLTTDLASEVDIKYQIHLCQKKSQQHSALKTLEDIPVRQRTSKINMALGELYYKDRLESNAEHCYKEVLKENPLALKAIISLLKLGVKAPEIINLTKANASGLTNLEWLQPWILAQSYLYSTDSSEAVNVWKKMSAYPNFRDNSDVVVTLAEAYYQNGDYKKAISLYKKVYSCDALYVKGMDIYATCLAKENLTKELEVLTNKLIARCDTGEQSPEPWLVLAYYSYLNDKKESKALYFTQKACLLSNNSIEALLLKGKIMTEAKSPVEALTYFLEAFNTAPYRFEALKALTKAYIADGKRSQAASMAQQGFKSFGQTPRTLTLYAEVLMSEPEKSSSKKTAKTSLEKAVKMDRGYLPAVYKLVQMLIDEKAHDKAIETLNKSLEYESNVKLHRLLGDCYTQINEHDKALHHNHIAKKLEVSYRNTTEAAQRLESQSNVSNAASRAHPSANEPSSLELEGEEVAESDNEMEESESEVVWSDNDNF